MNIMRLKQIFLAALVSASTYAQPRVATPAMGFTFDSSDGVIRPIRGIPGAALATGIEDLGFAVSTVGIAPGRPFALAVAVSRPGVRIVRWSGGRPSTEILHGAIESPDRFVFSPSGSIAVLYDSHSNRAQIITALPDSPRVHDLPFRPPTHPSIIAVADDATVVLAEGASSTRIAPDRNAHSLALPFVPVALAFRASSSQLLAATAAGELCLVTGIDAVPDIRLVFPGDGRIDRPVGIQSSLDGAVAFLAAANGNIAAIDFETGRSHFTTCPCAPVTLQPLGRPGLFQLTDSSGPLWLFDRTSSLGRVWFVPVDPERNEQ
jgi:hypothetical protein